MLRFSIRSPVSQRFVLFYSWSACPQWWSINSGSCYNLSSSKQSFPDAVTWCKATPGAYLVEIQSSSENSFVAGLRGNTNLWIGYSDQQIEGSWLWNNTGLPGRYTNWHKYSDGSREPGNYNGVQHCAQLSGSGSHSLTWDDRFCADKIQFVCERGKCVHL